MIASYRVAPLRKRDIKKKTENFLMEYFPSHLDRPGELDIEELLDITLFRSHGYLVRKVEKISHKFEAEMIPAEKVIEFPIKKWKMMIHGDFRQRFTGGHEASHIILGHDKQIDRNTISFGRAYHKDLKPFENSEWQAEYGGSCLLMPPRTLVPFVEGLYKKGYSPLMIMKVVSETYGVSYTAARIAIKKEDSLIYDIKESFKHVM